MLKQTRLRAGIDSTPRVPVQERLAGKFANRRGDQPKDKDPSNNPNRARYDERERRTCNNCHVRGHLAKECTNPTADKVKEALYQKSLKRSLVENEVKPDRPVLARTAATESGHGRGNGRGGGRTGTRAGGRGINPRNPHMTENATCAYCHTPNHTKEQCWRKNPHLRPGANLAAVRQAGLRNDREWEAEHLARERRQKALEDARDERETQREVNHNMDDAIEHNNGQYMFASSTEVQR